MILSFHIGGVFFAVQQLTDLNMAPVINSEIMPAIPSTRPQIAIFKKAVLMTINVLTQAVVFHALAIVFSIAILNPVFIFRGLKFTFHNPIAANVLSQAITFHSLIAISALNLVIISHMTTAFFACLTKFDELAPFPCKKHYCCCNLLLRNYLFRYYFWFLLPL